MTCRDEFEGERVSPAVERLRVLLGAAAGPLLTVYAAIAAVLAIVTALATESNFSAKAALLGAGPGWLAAYQVPITIDDQRLGLLPLLATIVVCVLVARTAGGAAQRLGYTTPAQSVTVIGTIAGAHAVLGVIIAVLFSGAKASADPLTAFCVPAAIAGVSATAGLARQCGLIAFARGYLDDAAVIGLRSGVFGLAGLLASGSVVLAVSEMLSAPTMHALFGGHASGFGSGLGMLLLSIAYLPNAVLFGLAFVTGPGFSFGEVEVGPFGFTGGEVLGVPLLAAIPNGYAGWWPVFLVLPAAVGALVGWTVRRCDPSPRARLRVVAVAGALVGFGCVVLGALAGGQLGSGGFDAVVIPVALVSVAAFLWIVVPGGLVASFAGERPVPVVEEAAADGAEGSDQGADEGAEKGAEEAEAEEPEPEEAAEQAEEPDSADAAEQTEKPEKSDEGRSEPADVESETSSEPTPDER